MPGGRGAVQPYPPFRCWCSVPVGSTPASCPGRKAEKLMEFIFLQTLCSTYRLMKRPNPQIHFANNHYRQHSRITSIIFPIQNAILWNYPYWYVPVYQRFFSVRNRFFPGMIYLLVWTTVPVDDFLFPALYYPVSKVLTLHSGNYITTMSAIEHELLSLREENQSDLIYCRKTCRTIS